MRALDPELIDIVWKAVEMLIPTRRVDHPKRGHRRRISDRVCFEGIVIRLVTGCSWQDAERLLDFRVSDTTLRGRRDEWIKAGVFDAGYDEALAGYDRVIGLDLSEVAADGSLHKAPCGGEGTGKNPTDRAKLGWKWSIATDKNGIIIGWTLDAANRNDCVSFEPTLNDITDRGLTVDIETLHLDRGYDTKKVRSLVAAAGIDDAVIVRRRRRGETEPKTRGLGLRWTVERTNSWLSNFGQLRRNTDRRTCHRHAQFCLAVIFLLTAKLVDWRDRWDPQT